MLSSSLEDLLWLKNTVIQLSSLSLNLRLIDSFVWILKFILRTRNSFFLFSKSICIISINRILSIQSKEKQQFFGLAWNRSLLQFVIWNVNVREKLLMLRFIVLNSVDVFCCEWVLYVYASCASWRVYVLLYVAYRKCYVTFWLSCWANIAIAYQTVRVTTSKRFIHKICH